MNLIPTSSTYFILLVTIALGIMSGCSSKPTRYYSLSAMSESKTPLSPTIAQNVSLGIGPIEIPDYANRPQIVTRNGNHELVFEEFHQRAEPLDKNISRVLTNNLAALIGTQNITSYPMARFEPTDYRVSIDITKFETAKGGTTTLEARWKILSSEDKKRIIRKNSSIVKINDGDDYEAIIAAESEALAALSEEIRDAIFSLMNDDGVASIEES